MMGQLHELNLYYNLMTMFDCTALSVLFKASYPMVRLLPQGSAYTIGSENDFIQFSSKIFKLNFCTPEK